MEVLKPEEVTISSDGRVIISNKQFAKSVLERIKKFGPEAVAGILDNCDCNRGCGQLDFEAIKASEIKSETKFQIK